MRTCLSCALLGLMLAFVPALASSPNRCTSSRASTPLPRFVTAMGSCTAACGNMGGSATVSCTGTCTIVDQDCDSGVQGYVQCNSAQPVYCPACQWCSIEGSCPEGGSISCGTWGYAGSTCSGGYSTCFVKCGNEFTFCPGHVGQIYCGF